MNLDDMTLLTVFVVSYLVSMYIQVNDPDIKVRRPDWIIGFMCSVVGGFISYKFFAFTTDNPGEIMFWTILASVASPRVFKFISNPKVQERLINSMFNRIVGGSSQNNNNDNNGDLR
jgi:hypothetical protein